MADKKRTGLPGVPSKAPSGLERQIAHGLLHARSAERRLQNDGFAPSLTLRQLYTLYRFANRDRTITLAEERTIRKMSERDLSRPHQELFADLIPLLSENQSLEEALPTLLERTPYFAFSILHSDIERIKLVRNYEEIRPSFFEEYLSRTHKMDRSLRGILEGTAFFYGINPQDPAEHAQFDGIFKGEDAPTFKLHPFLATLYDVAGKEGFQTLDFNDLRARFPLHRLLRIIGAAYADDPSSQKVLMSFVATNYANAFDPRDEESFRRTTDLLRRDAIHLAEYRAHLRSTLGGSVLSLTHIDLLSALIKAGQRDDSLLLGGAKADASPADERPHLQALYRAAAEQLRDAVIDASETCQSYLTIHRKDGLETCEGMLERDGKPLFLQMTTYWRGLPETEAEEIYSLIKTPLFTK